MIGKKILVLLLMVLLLTLGCTSSEETVPANNGEMVKVSLKYTGADGTVLVDKNFEVAKGTNAFEAMKEQVAVKHEMYDFGPFIDAIAGVRAPDGYYLALYVNGEYASKGISDYTLEENTTIEWKTESIASFG